MDDDTREQLARLAADLRNQLDFFRELGIETISLDATAAVYSMSPPESSLQRDSAAPAEPPHSQNAVATKRNSDSQADMVKHAANLAAGQTAGQIGLFGDSKPSSSLITLPGDSCLADIRADIGDCTRCKLHKGRTNIVFGEGNPKAQVVFVGEGPGADEDATGRPFVGRAGKLLDRIIESMGMRRDEVYIANVVKCRPPGNRTPERDETDTCEQFLFRQLTVIHPKVIVSLGLPAFQTLTRSRESMTRARGNWHDWNGIRLMPTYHPAFLLRSPDKKRDTWEDVQKITAFLAGPNVPADD